MNNDQLTNRALLVIIITACVCGVICTIGATLHWLGFSFQ